MGRFSAPIFLAQLLVVPVVALVAGLLAVEFLDSVLGSRGNQLLAWSCYALVGFAQGYLTGTNFPDVDCSWARFIWVVPVGVCVLLFLGEFRRDPHAAINEFLVINPYSTVGGALGDVVTAPTLATCLYSVGVWVALRARRGSDET